MRNSEQLPVAVGDHISIYSCTVAVLSSQWQVSILRFLSSVIYGVVPLSTLLGLEKQVFLWFLSVLFHASQFSIYAFVNLTQLKFVPSCSVSFTCLGNFSFCCVSESKRYLSVLPNGMRLQHSIKLENNYFLFVVVLVYVSSLVLNNT